MGWSNPPKSWAEMERTLSGQPPLRAPTAPPESPLSRKREPYQPRRIETEHADTIVPYAELHVHSHYSFLDGASSPEQLLEEAKRLGLHGIALTDHDGFYGVVRLAETAESYPEVKTIFGAELSLGLSGPQNGVADPEGSHLLVLARGEGGYHRLAAAITAGQLAGAEKGRPIYDLEQLAEAAGGEWLILSGCRKGAVRQALAAAATPAEGAEAAAAELAELVRLFGAGNVAVELFDHGHPMDSTTNDVLAELAAAAGLPVVATNVVHYATPSEHRLASAVAAVRARRSLDEMDGWLPASDGAHLRSGAEMAVRFARFPGAIEQTVRYAEELAFTLRSARPGLPKQDVPPGHTPMSWLRDLVWKGAARKYPDMTDAMRSRIERELEVIELKDFPGYFLIVYDIVREARSRGILCQGRGSAANSAVCYLLDITAVDSIFFDLPFERFLSSIRDEEPDIDVDFDSDRREEIIQYVYAKYGRHNAAQVANVISYRPKVAVRDMAKALGYSPGQQDAWSRQMEGWGRTVTPSDPETVIPDAVTDLATQLLTFPRHLGIHSGGMVLTDRPVGEVCPIEHARKENRTVLQWDKDDCAWMGLVKFDLLGLGMLAALQYAFDMARDLLGEEWSLDTMPKEEAGVYDMLCRADSIGVFQVESRAQMGTLPRLKPRRFYDLVIEIALIRPGPVQGGAVHPYIRRKTGKEEVTYLHPKLKPVLERTLGIPIFQEQLMQMAVAVGNCSAEDADLLRRAMGSKRGVEKIGRLKAKLYAGMAENGLDEATADVIYAKIEAFANFGFAESHSLSFALLVYASSWIKLHYPGVFLAALLRAQPMGFYSPQTLTADARRHGVEVRRPDILRSGVHAVLERVDLDAADAAPDAAPLLTGRPSCVQRQQPAVPETFERSQADETAAHRRDGAYAVRLGLADVSGIGEALAERIVAERAASGPYRSMADVSRRVGLDTAQLEALAAAGAFSGLGLERREALWSAGDAAQDRAQYLEGSVVVLQPPLLPILSAAEQVVYDLWATGISPDDHPVRHVREQLDRRGALAVAAMQTAESGRRVEVGGVVTHRQRPGTAGGITFLNIEDETGTLNVIASVGVWTRYRRIARESPALIVRGILERTEEGVVNLLADRFETLGVSAAQRSRDFR
ncbi:DNA polymerase III subunit alpha [Leifsonia sp. Root4]|uniref:error-prone DNA polymerase n=1 Tax=Leifsonia sp. Root4 TaxID=1736525 RepID=UPI0006FC9A1A|nr:error-prone DNA polymerase [Leifsonia sp. Root4]KQW05765.1 DNA polymerase III subunit alpha [Leifsonia sp. Root4]